MKNKTSISDYQEYKNTCRDAALNDEAFSSFKTNRNYTAILEHCSIEQGQDFINVIKENNNIDLNKIEKLKSNDKQGGARVEKYEMPFDEVSPSTLRYIKVLSELIKTFGNLEDFSIAEIGVGYGGQAKIIMDYFNIKDYNFFDLEEPLALTKRYLKDYNNLNFYTQQSIPNNKIFNLVISNYAYSELTRETQDIYYENVIKKSTHGYMICNYLEPEFNIGLRNKHEIMDMITVCKSCEEKPLTHPRNYVLYW